MIKIKCLQTLPHVPWGPQLLLVENHSLLCAVRIKRIDWLIGVSMCGEEQQSWEEHRKIVPLELCSVCYLSDLKVPSSDFCCLDKFLRAALPDWYQLGGLKQQINSLTVLKA